MVAGGDFECGGFVSARYNGRLQRGLQDDLLIAVPTKDMVLFTRAGNKKSIRKMIKQAQKIFEENQKESPFLIFSRDVFYYNKSTKELEISKKYHISN